MNLDLKSTPLPAGVLKQVFQLKTSQKDGPILQIHHTVPGFHGESQRIRFVNVAFEKAGEKMAASDHKANIFIIDFTNNKYWLLVKVDSCTCLAFSTRKQNELVFGLQNGSLIFINTETANIENRLDGHTVPVTQISFSQSKYCLTASQHEAFIWDLQSNSQIHKLSMREGVILKQILFMPVMNHILACFQDDIMHIWKLDIYGNFECFKQIVPETWKTHHVRCITFTRNGRAMVIGCHSQTVIVISLDSWSIIKTVQLPNSIPGVRHAEFLPQPFDGGCNKILCLLSTQCTLHFLNIDSAEFLPRTLHLEDGIRHFTCSHNGKYLVVVIHTGEINVYTSISVVGKESSLMHTESIHRPVSNDENMEDVDVLKIPSSTVKITNPMKDKLKQVNCQMRKKLDLKQLRPILKEFGEYPETYRPLIWKTILKLPCNESAYLSLLNREQHPAYMDIENQYPLENKSLLKQLKRLLSCLAHWCPLFGETKFLPLFVFPFIKVFHSDPVICFEAVMAIIITWCQRWFEYFPFPPVNVLTIIENILAQQDNELMKWFYDRGATSQIYAWPLLEVAFSEVLSTSEWMQLWDHILSNEPAFLLMAVVAYNIILKVSIKNCKSDDDLEFFYHNQNPINMKRFISKVYCLLDTTNCDIHPRKYLEDFTPLTKPVYPMYNQYPTLIVDYKAQQMDQLRKEREDLQQQEEAINQSKTLQDRRRREDRRTEIEKARLLRLEEVYRETMQEEEERLAEKRQKLAALRNEVRMQELELLEGAREKLLQHQTQQRQAALDHLSNNIDRKRKKQEQEFKELEDEIQWYYTSLLEKKQTLEAELASQSKTDETYATHVLKKQQEQLSSELNKLREAVSDAHISRKFGMERNSTMKCKAKQCVEIKVAEQMAENSSNIATVQNTIKAAQLEAQSKALEEEIEELVDNLVGIKFRKEQSKLKELTERDKEQNGLYQDYKSLTESLLHRYQNSNSQCLSKICMTPSENNR